MYHSTTLYEKQHNVFIKTSPDMYTYKYTIFNDVLVKLCLYQNCLEQTFHKCSFCKNHKRELKYNNRLYSIISYVKQPKLNL